MVLPFLLLRPELTFLLEQSVRDTEHDIPSKREGEKERNNEMTKTKHMFSKDSPLSTSRPYSISIAPYFVWAFAQIASLEVDRYGTTSTTRLLLRLLRKRELSLILFDHVFGLRRLGWELLPRQLDRVVFFSLTWKKFEEVWIKKEHDNIPRHNLIWPTISVLGFLNVSTSRLQCPNHRWPKLAATSPGVQGQVRKKETRAEVS